MTLFGKIVTGIFFVFVVGIMYYGISSAVKRSAEEATIAALVEEAKSKDQTASTTSSALETGSSSPAAASSAATAATGKKKPFTSLLQEGGTYKCNVTQSMGTITSEGVVYMHNFDVVANFSTGVQGQTIKTAMIAKEGYMYSWSYNQEGTGTKTKLTTDDGTSSTAPKTYTWNGSQVGDYNCEPWTYDPSLFKIPESVTFIER